MTDNAAFLSELARVRALVEARLDAVRRREAVYGTETELQMFLRDLAHVDREARAGAFDMSGDQRTLSSANQVLDSWPFEDPLGLELVGLERAYRKL